MTMFLCSCGEAHDSAVRGPCTQSFSIPLHGMYALNRLERFYIVNALAHRHGPNPSLAVQRIIDMLGATREEIQSDADFCRLRAEGF